MLRNCFLDFAVEHWFGCRATEPGFAGDIGAIEDWLIDWLLTKLNSTSVVIFMIVMYLEKWQLRKERIELYLESVQFSRKHRQFGLHPIKSRTLSMARLS